MLETKFKVVAPVNVGFKPHEFEIEKELEVKEGLAVTLVLMVLGIEIPSQSLYKVKVSK